MKNQETIKTESGVVVFEIDQYGEDKSHRGENIVHEDSFFVDEALNKFDTLCFTQLGFDLLEYEDDLPMHKAETDIFQDNSIVYTGESNEDIYEAAKTVAVSVILEDFGEDSPYGEISNEEAQSILARLLNGEEFKAILAECEEAKKRPKRIEEQVKINQVMERIVTIMNEGRESWDDVPTLEAYQQHCHDCDPNHKEYIEGCGIPYDQFLEEIPHWY